MKRILTLMTVGVMLLSIAGCGSDVASDNNSYTIVTTGQSTSYDNDGNIITTSTGDDYYGQDADYDSDEFSFTDNEDGTITDNNTGLTWQQIPIDEKMSWEEAVAYCESLELAGYDDWRLPSAKELFSLSDFEVGWPFLDTNYFEFPDGASSEIASGPSQDGGPQGSGPQGGDSAETAGDMTSEEMPPPPTDEDMGEGEVSKQEGQFWSSNFYQVGTTHGDAPSAFGVNHATGHIKAYPAEAGGDMGKYVRAVRGDVYGINAFVDNGDGTVTDEASGLMWMEADAGMAMEWNDALLYAESFEFAGYDDWHLPDVKELQSILDYSGVYPAIDQTYFDISELEENVNYYFWTSTSAYFSPSSPGYGYGWYVAFGYAVGDDAEDSHGAGAVRFSQKYLDSPYEGEGGDNILNSVRLVRNTHN